MLAKGPHKGLVGEQLGGTPAVSGLQIKLGGVGAALAFPLDLGARPLCRRLRGRGCGEN